MPLSPVLRTPKHAWNHELEWALTWDKVFAPRVSTTSRYRLRTASLSHPTPTSMSAFSRGAPRTARRLQGPSMPTPTPVNHRDSPTSRMIARDLRITPLIPHWLHPRIFNNLPSPPLRDPRAVYSSSFRDPLSVQTASHLFCFVSASLLTRSTIATRVAAANRTICSSTPYANASSNDALTATTRRSSRRQSRNHKVCWRRWQQLHAGCRCLQISKTI
eukprot:6209799-Pleurochrysis_carterae.AAC.2